jgi:hypothetical protein
VADTGSNDASGNTSATANVTPVSELIVAQLMAALPADAFEDFRPGQVPTDALAQAVTAIVDALKAAGIDLGSIDPLKAELVPATDTAEGNGYDKALDKLGESVPPEALPQLVNQVGNASDSGAGLDDAMQAVSGGALPNCAAALSGTYRTLDFFGKSQVRELDFKNLKWRTEGVSGEFAIVQSSTDACAFKVAGPSSEIEVVMGASGVGTYRGRNTTGTNPGTTGYIFPVQSHPLTVMAGDWNFVQSGYMPGDGLVHWPGKLGFGGSQAVSVCEYDAAGTCHPDAETDLTASARADGGFNLDEAGEPAVANLWAFRATSGAFTIFGTTNAAGVNTGETEQSHIVATRPAKLSLPAQGAVVKASTSVLRQPGDSSTRTVLAPFSDVNTVVSVNTAARSYVRRMEEDGREETIHVNKPVDGVRTRVSTMDFYQLVLPGAGMTVGFNAGFHPTVPFVHTISVHR